MPQKSSVVIVIPARDEAAAIAGVLAAVPPAIDGLPVRTVVVDDGSTDDTAQRARATPGVVVLAHRRPLGTAEALRTGLLHARGLDPAVVANLDADGQQDPADLPRLVRPILAGHADVVQAVGDPAARTPGRRALDVVASLLARRRMHDVGNGLRALDPAAIPALLPLPRSRFPHAQTRLVAHVLGLRVRVVPCAVAPRRHGTTHTPTGARLVVAGAVTLVRRRLWRPPDAP